MKKTGAGIASNPVLVGGVTVLVVIVAVFLSYNANQGLPFVPTTSLKVRVPNGANLVPGNEIRSGGSRVGVIDDMTPVRGKDGKVVAELDLKLDKRIGDVPQDSTFRIRPRSALGLKYLELDEGSSKDAFANGDTVPADQGSAVDGHRRGPEDVRCRDAQGQPGEPARLRRHVRGPRAGRRAHDRGAAAAARAPAAGDDATSPTRTRELTRFFDELADAARIVAPVSEQQAALFTSMADTFEALGRDEGALKQTISDSPPTMDVAIESFRAQRPFLANLEGFGDDFAPGDRRAARRAADAQPRRRGRDPGQQARAPSSTRSSARRSTSCASSPRRPARCPASAASARPSPRSTRS